MVEEPIHYPDELVAALARLFLEHPAWQRAAGRVSGDSESSVYFTHRPAEAWHLSRRSGRSILETGRSDDPDFVFRFSPGSIKALQQVSGGVGDFAVTLFSLLDEVDANLRVDLRVAAPFSRLRKRGYLGLLLSAGPKVVVYGAGRGIRSLGALKRLVDSARLGRAEDWEC